jgi:hypothetical protein
VKPSIAAWLSGGLLCLHLLGTGVLATVMWEQSTRDVATAQASNNYLRLLAKDWCRTIPPATPP